MSVALSLALPLTLSFIAAPLSAADDARARCDRSGVCLRGDDARQHEAARRELAAGRAAQAATILTALAEERRTREDDASLLVANDLAVALARSGRRIEAALVLEDWLGDRASLDSSFGNLTRLYGALADPAGDGAPLDGLALANVEAPRPAPTATIADAATALRSAPAPRVDPAVSQSDTASATAAVADALERWRDAWDAGDVETYLDSYAPQRSPRAGLDRGAWERQRRARVTPQRDISVSIDDLRIEVDGARAVTRFEQTYRARSYADRTSKRLSWERQDGRWRIVEEAAR